MQLWKIDLYRDGDIFSVSSGVIAAPTQAEAITCAQQALGSADYAHISANHIEEIEALPSGALYVRFPYA